ncbi:MAG: ferredoxin [Rhodospirillales bacterium]|nr:ferredoxin [Rhodospirillales bacterium]
MADLLARLSSSLADYGLLSRGGFHPRPSDGVPGETGTLVLIGNAGPELWRVFTHQRRDEPHPLDAWTRRILTDVAHRFDARALFPFGGPPTLPFQRWARRAEAVFPSPIGPLIHPDYGLWHAYRGALAFTDKIALPLRRRCANPCRSCLDRPCLSACPVDAFDDDGYEVPACVAHISSGDGGDCMNHGCGARRACPVGTEFAPATAQARFHMDSFVAARRAASLR